VEQTLVKLAVVVEMEQQPVQTLQQTLDQVAVVALGQLLETLQAVMVVLALSCLGMLELKEAQAVQLLLPVDLQFTPLHHLEHIQHKEK
jgi:hypothetical protein